MLFSVVDEIMVVEPALTCKEPATARKMTRYVAWFGARWHCTSLLIILKLVVEQLKGLVRITSKCCNWTYAACLYDTPSKQNNV